MYPAIRSGLLTTDIPQPPRASGDSAFLMIHGTAARTLPGSYLFPSPSTVYTPASGAADARRWAARSP